MHPSKVILIDGSGYIFRAFYALPPMTRSDGISVNALYGFTRMLMALMKNELSDQEHNPVACAVVFDAARATFRQAIDPNYKANRKETPPELIPQFPLIKQTPPAFGLTAIEQEGFEADDIIASLARLASKNAIPVTIYSSDKDLMQLIDANITMIDPMKNKTITADDVKEKFGVPPHLLGDALALTGDSSDNIKGVSGIGIKTAAELLNQWGGLENLLAHAQDIPQPSRRKNLTDHADAARLARRLVTLREDVPSLPALTELLPLPLDATIVSEFLDKHEFRSLKKELTPLFKETQGTLFPLDDTKELQNLPEQELPTFLRDAQNHGRIALLWHPEERQLQLAHKSGVTSLPDDVHHRAMLAPLLESDTMIVIGYHLKDWMRHHKITIARYDDVAIMAYLSDGAHLSLELKDIIERHGGSDMHDLAPVQCLIPLSLLLTQQLARQRSFGLYRLTECPLIGIIARMEQRGVHLDKEALDKLSIHLKERMVVLEAEIFAAAGRPFAIQSPKQLAEILFDELKLPKGKKGKSGVPSTSRSVLQELSDHHRLPAKILDYRHFAKLASTYTDPLSKQIDPSSGRIHSSFALTATSTGRLSSLHPNLQNIPIRTHEGRAIRKAFVAEKDHRLIAADYSQIELRLLAHIADVKKLKESLLNDEDIHTATASHLFNFPLAQVDKDHRRRAKAVIFGMIYGISPFGLAKQLGITREDARELITAFFKHYPEIKHYQEKTIQEARQNGFVTTLFGRRIHIPTIRAKALMQRQFGERAAINAPIQGSAADVIKRAMIQIEQQNLSATMLIQVHDELLFETRKEDAKDQLEIIARLMKYAPHPAVTLSVPLEVACHMGHHWEEAHG